MLIICSRCVVSSDAFKLASSFMSASRCRCDRSIISIDDALCSLLHAHNPG